MARQQLISQWLQSLPIPWLVGGTNGKLEVGAYGSVLDTQNDLLDAAVKARMPGQAPGDALPHIGHDRLLVQGPAESDDDFRLRIADAWVDWPRAGTALELLLQLYHQGFTGLTMVQQNGLYYQLSTPPNADPFVSLTVGNTDLTGEVQCSMLYPYTRQIPASTPWWYFSPNTDLCSRYAFLIPAPVSTRYIVTVYFTGTEDGSGGNPWPVATWPAAYADTTYRIVVGVPIVGSGPPPLGVYADGSTKTTAHVSVGASAPWVGSVDVMAFASGIDPFNPTGLDIDLFRRTVKTWGRAAGTCVALYVLNSGDYLGWPIGTLGAGVLGPASVTTYQIEGV